MGRLRSYADPRRVEDIVPFKYPPPDEESMGDLIGMVGIVAGIAGMVLRVSAVGILDRIGKQHPISVYEQDERVGW
ncbi:hypothetical protein SpCBS45565_g04100 [Spizellomyces sp. 'palustris']|nr:hypothetical protein SpCBS45565_g04100 [Spizellomyces sp. 'palustris']